MKKRKVFTKKAMILYVITMLVSIILTSVDSNNMAVFFTTKIIALALDIMLIYCIKYIPKKYL